jgi:hypothetical protein
MTRSRLFFIPALVLIVIYGCSGSTTSTGPQETPSGQGGAQTTAPGSGAATTAGSTRTASIYELQNDVDARQTQSDQWINALEGQQLLTGGGTKTGEESRVRVDITDGTILRIGPNTEFQLAELSPQAENPVTRLQLEAGKVWVWVTRSLGAGAFEIETPSGVATVRGSLMSVEYDRAAGRVLITCLDGECTLRDRAQIANIVTLIRGQRSEIAGAGQAPLATLRMTRAQIREWITEFPEAREIAQRLLDETPEETATPPGGAGGGQTACDHPYFPLRPGATWTYNSSSGHQFVWTVDSVTGDASEATATVTNKFAEGSVTWHWQCSATNGIASFDFGSVSTTEFGRIVEMQATSSSGAWLLPPETLTVGATWTHTYEMTGKVKIPGGQENLDMTTSVVQSLQVVSANPVEVGGQTYEGLQISEIMDQTTNVTMPGFQVPPTTLQTTSQIELARGVGLVRSTSNAGGQADTLTLVSFSIP